MDTSKVIITNQKTRIKEFPFENEIGLSSYDLALISINKISKMRNYSINSSTNITYLI